MPVFSMGSRKMSVTTERLARLLWFDRSSCSRSTLRDLDATQRSKFQQQMCCLLFILAQSFLHSSNDAKPPNALLHKFNGVPPPATSTAIKAIMMEGNQPNFQNYVCCQLKYKISLGGVFWKQNLNFTPNGVKVFGLSPKSSSNACKAGGML